MADYTVLPALAAFHQQKVDNAAAIEAGIEAAQGIIRDIMADILPTDIVADEDEDSWTRVTDPATGALLGLEVRLYLTDGVHLAPISPWGYFKIVGQEVHLLLGSDPLKVATLTDWARPTGLAALTAAYDRLLEMQAEAEGGA